MPACCLTRTKTIPFSPIDAFLMMIHLELAGNPHSLFVQVQKDTRCFLSRSAAQFAKSAAQRRIFGEYHGHWSPFGLLEGEPAPRPLVMP